MPDRIILHFKEIKLIALGHVTQCAKLTESLNMALADLGAGSGKLLGRDKGLAGVFHAAQFLRRRLAQTGDGDKGRAKLLVPHDEEFCGIGLVKVDIRKLKAAHVEFVHGLKSDKQIFLVGGEIALFHVVYLPAHIVRAAAHQGCVKAALLAAAVEICAVEGKRPVHLEPGDAEGHHNIGHGVGLGEEVGYFPAGFDIPIRHLERAHLLLSLAGEPAAALDLALTYILHDLEGQRGLHAHRDKVEHDVVAAGDSLIDVGNFVDDKVADIAGPNIRAVGEAGKAHKGGKAAGLGVGEHLAGKRSAKLRHADAAGFADDGVIIGQPQSRRACEDGHGLGV